MKPAQKKGGRIVFIFLCMLMFFGCFALGSGSKVLLKPVWSKEYEIKLTDEIGTLYTDFHISEMAIGGGSAGHTLAMIYAYRDVGPSPVPVKLLFGAVGPSSFYTEDWGTYGFNKDTVPSVVAYGKHDKIQPLVFKMITRYI